MKHLHKLPDKKKKIPRRHLCYRPKLEDLSAFCTATSETPIDIQALILDIPLSSQADFSQEIYAIIPIKETLWRVSCLIYRENLLLVEATPEYLVKQLLHFAEHLDFPVYKKTLNHLLDCNSRLTPIATRHYSLFPSAGISLPQTMWINPGRIEHILPRAKSSILCFENLFTLHVDCPIDAIHRRMLKSFWAHAILKREHDIFGTPTCTSLLEFLNVTSSKETRTVLKSLQYQHIPKYKNEFFKHYPKYNRMSIKKSVKRSVYAKLRIEE